MEDAEDDKFGSAGEDSGIEMERLGIQIAAKNDKQTVQSRDPHDDFEDLLNFQ